ncbi:hypothetical protein [Caulobacter sp. 1776]|uniref:hypothetical protein n=1 Tax=Caulobacter sp. 1776 TaxID=3156420 RepID=UPI00339296EA
MSVFRLLPALVIVAASLAAAPVVAGARQGGLPLDPELLPANSGPGDCVTRRVTGPGGAYRWDRVECDPDHGWAGHDQWGYGRNRLEVETRGPELLGGPPPRYNSDVGHGYSDRYGERRHDQAFYERRADDYEHEHVRAYDSGYDQGRGGPVDSYPPSYAYDYVAAGRDEAGYLVWPGKTP